LFFSEKKRAINHIYPDAKYVFFSFLPHFPIYFFVSLSPQLHCNFFLFEKLTSTNCKIQCQCGVFRVWAWHSLKGRVPFALGQMGSGPIHWMQGCHQRRKIDFRIFQIAISTNCIFENVSLLARILGMARQKACYWPRVMQTDGLDSPPHGFEKPKGERSPFSFSHGLSARGILIGGELYLSGNNPLRSKSWTRS
jgi:hypothetical protein